MMEDFPLPIAPKSIIDIGSSGCIQSSESVEIATSIMTSFGLWLKDKGYDDIHSDKYSFSENVLKRLNLTNTTNYRTTGEGEISALPVTLFKDVIGTDYSISSEDQRASFDAWQDRLHTTLGGLVLLSADAKDLASSMQTQESLKMEQANLRIRAANLLNGVAMRDDGQKIIYSGVHFGSFSETTIANKKPAYWLGRILSTYDSANYDLVDEAIVEESQKILKDQKTTIADRFILETYEEFIMQASGFIGYLVVSQLFYGGDMHKAYRSVPAIAKMTGQPMPEGWQEFQGSTTDCSAIKDLLSGGRINDGLDGYLAISNELCGGKMQIAYMNTAAVARMTNLAMPKGWSVFKGNTTDLTTIRNLFDNSRDKNGIDGYLAIADELYPADMQKAYINISAVAKMTGHPMPEGWQVFKGSTTDFTAIKDLLASGVVSDGIDGYLATADELYGGNMLKAYINISAVAKMTGHPMPEGWQGFKGNTTDFKTIKYLMSSDMVNDGMNGYLAIADELYPADMQKTFMNISAVAKMTGQPMPKGWQEFHGSTNNFTIIKDLLSNGEVKDDIDGYITIANLHYGGDMLKTHKNISAVAKMTGQPMPKGWQLFQGSTQQYIRKFL